MQGRVYSKVKLSPNGPETLMSVCVDNTLHISYHVGIGVQDFLRANRIYTTGRCDRSCLQEVIEMPPQVKMIMQRFLKTGEWSDIEYPTYTEEEVLRKQISPENRRRIKEARKKRFKNV